MTTRTTLWALALSFAALAALPGDVSAGPPTQQPRSLDEVERTLAQLDKRESEAKRERDALVREAASLHSRAVARGRLYVRLRRAGLLPVSGGFDDLIDHAARVERLRRALARDLAREKQLVKRRTEVAKQLETLRAQRDVLEAQHQAMDKARSVLLAAEDRAMAFERAFSSSGSTNHTAIYGAGIGPSDPSELSSGFASLKGRLPFPVPGRAEIRSARRSGGPGLEMRVATGSAVRAVYAGRVAFADRYADYGSTVIVDHGDSHYSVSANLSDIAVSAGDQVSTGSRLGNVGPGGVLYIEIRVGTDTADPAEWFGI